MNLKKIYKKIANDNGVTVEEVEREFFNAIEQAYFQSDKKEIFKNGKPSNEEFIKFIVNKVDSDYTF